MNEAVPSPLAIPAGVTGASGSSSGSEDGRALLQERLGLFGKVCFLIDVLYYPLFNLAVGLDPAVGFRAALKGLISYQALGEYIVFGSIWLLCRTGTRSLRALKVTETVGILMMGAVVSSWPFVHPYPVAGVYEMLLALVALLILRAILVPSSARRTLLLSSGACGLGLVSASVASRSRELAHLTPITVLLLVLCWVIVAVSFSTVASAVIYGLRKQVRDARRLGQYTLLERLGAGAMGEVYLASHAMLRRRTAIKLLRTDTDGRGLERFEREVQHTSQLTHPNTIAIYDYGRTAEGLFYYVMEYLEGGDLERVLAVSGPQPPGRVIHILRQVCGALEEAHGQGLLHRDIKPANLFLCRRRGVPDLVKVLDFGLVKELGNPVDGALSRSGTLTGTPLYLAPEAVSSPEQVDARGDLYSLGAVGYALLTGSHLFEGRSVVEICAHHLHTPPVPPKVRLGRELPEDLCAVILRCLEKRPEARYASARELREALEVCTDAGRWTEEDAERWWAAHGAVLESSHSKRDGSLLTGTQTLVMDLTRRVA
ncbi:MAG TPA: serine/threonine-protein kinase [Archangium sp.]|jgi:serine/threonine-protein kinase|uniref:serine/threonine-protein kinase n=1 Tax=Archangium sp. TaxID=1872627 RepID=UPI002ED83209